MFRSSITCALILIVGTLVTIKGSVSVQGNSQSPATVHLRWPTRAGVSRYRLQVASDRSFRDIVLDRLVTGSQTEISDLAPGKYFWRIAPLTKTLGGYSAAATIMVAAPSLPRPRIIPSSTATIRSVQANSPVTTGGWRAAVGDIARPLVAHLRSRDSIDVVGTNGDGVTFALDSGSGVARWSFHGRRSATSSVFPVIINSRLGTDDVVVFDGPSVVKIDGRTGRELWQSPLPVAASSAIALSDGSGSILIVVDTSLRRLLVVSGDSGNLISQTQLPGRVAGVPATMGDQKGIVLIAYENGNVEMRDKRGAVVRFGSARSPATTGPVVIKGRRQTLVLLGTREGLTAMAAGDLRPLGRVTIKDDGPRGDLIAKDLDGDGVAEVIMTTQRGHLIAIHGEDGKVLWDAPVNDDAQALAFADLDGDNVLDVITPGTQTFATAFSGRDGSIIWKDPETPAVAANHAAPAQSRGLITVPVGSATLLISSDASRTGLRAVEFPRGALRPHLRGGLQYSSH
ncbi:MAG: PQQ-binding-like beta-propeller repeat protein [Pyrinomonadaceae bacterium]